MSEKHARAVVFLAEGFEESEAVVPIDLLRRAGVKVRTCSITSKHKVTSSHGITLLADMTWEKFARHPKRYDALILPGGGKGTDNLLGFKPLRKILKKHFARGRLTAAICAAPTVLGRAGILRDKAYTCFPGCESEGFAGRHNAGASVVVDGNLITARAMGSSLEFGRALVRALAPDASEAIDKGTQYACRTEVIQEG